MDQVFEHIVRSSADGILAFDRELRYTVWNPAMESIAGKPASEVLGQRAFDLFPYLTDSGEDAYFHAALRGEAAIAPERLFSVGNSGRVALYETHYAPLLDEAGSITGGIAILLDVTERRRAEANRTELLSEQIARREAERVGAALRQSEERYRAFVANSSEGIWLAELDEPMPVSLDPDAQVAHLFRTSYLAECNDAMARMYGYSRSDEILGARLGELLPPSDPDNVEYLLAFVTSGYRLEDAESHEVDREGRPKYFQNNFVGIVENGHVVRAWGTQRDVTERVLAAAERDRLLDSERRAREEQSRLRAAAEEANRLKDEFLATMSHELRTPLNAILGWSQLLLARPVDEATRTRALESIARNARAQAEIVDDVLDVSRIITGKLRVEPRPVAIAEVIEGAVNTVRPAAEAKGVHLELELDPQPVRVLGDPDRIRQVVWNLLSNAVKFTPREGVVRVRLALVAPNVEIEVADTGAGISAEFLPHVFDRFRQADSSTTRVHGGLGLGLSIARQIVELHGGTISASSGGEGAGAEFVVRLPALAAVAGDAEPSEAGADLLSLEGLRVLVVDDEPDARDLIATVLGERRAEVVTAASVAEALAAFERFSPDVLVCDIGMPGEDGYGLIRKVRERPDGAGGRTPAVALTAYARSEDRVRALAEGYQRHVSKPADPEEIVAAVSSLAEIQNRPQ